MPNPKILSSVAASAVTLFSSVSFAGEELTPTNLHVNPSFVECDIQFSADLTQSEFQRFVRESGEIVAYKNFGGARALEAGDFELSLAYSSSPVDQLSGAWNNTFHHPDSEHELGDTISFPMLMGRVGLGRNLDIGAYFTGNFAAEYRFAGAGLKWNFQERTKPLLPEMAASVDYGILFGVADTTVHSLSFDYHASKTWGLFTPYAGVGGIVTYAEERSPVVDLEAEANLTPHGRVGLGVRPWRGINLDASATLGAVTTYMLRTAYIF
jgi:hypothetical protein